MQNSLAVILPVHNEVHSLEKVILEWHATLKNISACDYHFIICEDGSTDGTKELIIELTKKFPIVNLSVNHRRGYGKAVMDGIRDAKADYLLCIDSDGQCRPDDFFQFWKNRSNANFVIGNRRPRHDPFIRLVYSKIFFCLHRALFPNALHDPSCPFVLGHQSFYLELLPYLGYLREGFWWGFVAACVKTKKSLLEINITHYKRIAGNTQVYHFKKMPGIIIRNIMGLLKLRFKTS